MGIIPINWVHVPPGTQLEVRVGPPDAAFISGGDIFRDDKGLLPVKQWNDTELRPGPAIELLQAGVDYTVDIRATSASRALAEGTVVALLREQASGAVLVEDKKPLKVEPNSHDLIRIFIDADPLLAPAGAVRGRSAGRRGRAKSASRRRTKRGK